MRVQNGGTMFMKEAPRSNRIGIRLTDVERGRLVEMAKGRGLSQFVRDVLRAHIERQRKKKGR
jgi:hypothetical protein